MGRDTSASCPFRLSLPPYFVISLPRHFPLQIPDSFRIRTYEKCTDNSFGSAFPKRLNLKFFRIRTYEKRRGRVGTVNQQTLARHRDAQYLGYSLRNTVGVEREYRARLRFEMVGKHKTRPDLVRVFAFALAILIVVFVGQALHHSHLKGQNEASCQVCQAAHIGSGPTALTASLFSPLLAIGYVQPFVATIHQEFFFHGAPSRAPPSA
jgi:hypothetical protein